MIIREKFSKFATKKAILLGAVSLLLIGSGAAATQASFNDSGNAQITAQSATCILLPWGFMNSPSFQDVLPNENYTSVGTLSNWGNCNMETVAYIDIANVKNPVILDATTATLKIDGVSVYSGKLRNLNSGPIKVLPSSSMPIELTINSNTNVLTQDQVLNSIPIKFQSKSVPAV